MPSIAAADLENQKARFISSAVVRQHLIWFDLHFLEQHRNKSMHPSCETVEP
jgi:hypothetical protein